METLVNLADKIVIPVIIAFVSYYIARKQIVNAGVTHFRQQWIDDLRESISTFVSKAELIAMIDLEDDESYFEYFQELSVAHTRIELMLNPLEDEHNKIVDALVALRELIHDTRLSEKKLGKKLDAKTVVLLEATKKVLKSEWIRVKNGK